MEEIGYSFLNSKKSFVDWLGISEEEFEESEKININFDDIEDEAIKLFAKVGKRLEESGIFEIAEKEGIILSENMNDLKDV